MIRFSNSFSSTLATGSVAFAAVLATGCLVPAAAAQQTILPQPAPVATQQIAELSLPSAPLASLNESSSSLPEAPDATSSLPEAPAAASLAGDPVTTHASRREAGVYDTVIQPGQTAPRLTFGNEFAASLKSSVSSTAILGWAISAGYSQLTDGSPNFENGSTIRQYGQRIGAAAARASSETIFGNGIIAPLVHEDPRYYRMGPGNGFFKRAAYSITRPLITRTNGGRQTLNIWDLGGDLSGAALTPVYYPAMNTSFNEVMKTFGGSVGGDAIGFAVSEFLPDILHGLHLRRAQ